LSGGAEFLHADRRAGRQASIAKPTVAVRNLGNALKVRNADNGDRKEKWYAKDSEKKAKATLAECCGLQ
jgi:hypothetical protein